MVTADVPLADRIVAKGAIGLNPRGEVYTEDNVKEAHQLDRLLTRHGH